nr:MAG TPA: hypothetical protein [Caudoviricetes sp.]
MDNKWNIPTNPFFDSLEFTEKKIEYDWKKKLFEQAEALRLIKGIQLHKNKSRNKRVTKSKRKKRR